MVKYKLKSDLCVIPDWPQKMAETCRNYLYIWTSEMSWK